MTYTSRLTVWTLTLGMSFGMAAAQFAPQGPPPPPPGAYQNGPGGWDAPPGEYQDDAHRNGFRDGIEGARKDYENHRRPDVNNRDEFRHPNVPRNLRRAYRDGFRRGYSVGVQHLMGGGGPRY